MDIYNYLYTLFKTAYSAENLIDNDLESFKEYIHSKIGTIDAEIEGYYDSSKQRDLSVKFHWGHNHDFGQGFFLEGRMGDRHLRIIESFIKQFDLPTDLSGKKILDIGAWTGGISLLLVAMGATVYAIEEVKKYSDMLNYLSQAFGIQDRLKCISNSLYDTLPDYAEEFDAVIYAGVIYHVSDPLLSLRLIFTGLKDMGSVYLETFGTDSDRSICYYEGPSVVNQGSAKNLNRTGWNFFVPSPKCLRKWCEDVGFSGVKTTKCINRRILARATRFQFQDFCRAGFSKPLCR
jgi:2-polyprenyl-3-methyl-5-hydroxy-6-metoxy-1,4-benzoquinol methylase